MAATKDEPLVGLALRMTGAQRHPPTGLGHHADRGAELTSERYLAVLHGLGIEVRLSTLPWNPFPCDVAVCQSHVF